MNKIDFIKNFGEITKRDENYYIFAGLINCLTPKEFFSVCDFSFKYGKLGKEIFINKNIADFNNEKTKRYEQFFRQMFNTLPSISNYHSNQACSYFLSSVYDTLSIPLQNEFLSYSLFSKYKNDRRRAYNIISSPWKSEYKEILEKNFFKFFDLEAAEIIIDNFPASFLNKNYTTLIKFFPEEYLKYDFSILKLRNKMLIKIFKYIENSIILKLKESDPVSYIYILKECDKKIDSDFAYKVFVQTKRKSLLLWYGQMGLWNVLIKIKEKFLTKQST
ncbi:MAG TPA: hypothetical protein ACFYD7_08990 [Candidatus Wujingus californicus]|uniref:hypothetical protein n=1 Tax=Candidatus Wujingus californicus TaxID=3367618 RepID=UPI001D26CA6C|nr:hypothetical protein [Planctomycetota bacterium]MDO8094764.1 hypothetical protein [Candidatus Brocadiales bacterium]MDO8131931.1 hypothetical protein [Candidatus Brocadiales bacterium]